MSDKNSFIEFLMEQKALLFGEFMTKSGRKSPYFINMGEFRSGEAVTRLGEFYAAHIMQLKEAGKLPPDSMTLFGPAYKGIPLCVSAAVALHQNYTEETFWTFNRKEIKDHGEGGGFVGKKLDSADSVLILDDVITAGTAIREVLPLIESSGASVSGLVVAVDRMERGRTELSAVEEVRRELDINVFPIITVRDIVSYLRESGDATAADRIEVYLGEYGAQDPS